MTVPDNQGDDHRQRQADERDLRFGRSAKFNQELTTTGIFPGTCENIIGFYLNLFAGIGLGTIAKLDTLILRHIERVGDNKALVVIWTPADVFCVL
jgi:hypothetical protein